MRRIYNTRVVLIVFVLLIALIMPACQPTPENAAVQQKGANVSLQAKAVPYNKADFPDMYKDSYSKNGADITFDAKVEAPDSDALPTYDINPVTFTQMQVDSIIKALFGNVQMYEPANVTKSQIEPEYLEALAALNDKKANPDQYENTLEYYQGDVDRLKQEMENAADTDTLVPIDNKLKKTSEQGIEDWSGRGDLGKDKMATLSIINSTNSSFLGNNSYLEFTNGSRYMDMSTLIPVMQDNGPVKLKITKEEAIQKADDMIRSLGADNMEYAACATGIMESTDGHYTSEYDPQRPQAYLVYYTRNVSGVPATYDLRAYSNDITDESYSASQLYERIMVAVDDTGITHIRWQAPVSITRTSAENNLIIPFDDVMTLAKEQLGYFYAAYEEQPAVSGYAVAQASSPVDNGDVISNDVNIQRITLGLMQLPVKNENRSQLVPVWDFFGYYETEFASGAKETHYMNDKSLLTINAVTGSVIDRNLGY